MARTKSQHELDLEDDVAALELLANKALDAFSFQAAVTARSRLITVRAELCRAVQERIHGNEKDPLKRIQRMRENAMIDGSWVAASQLAEAERRLLAEREAELLAREEAKQSKQSDEEVIAEIEAALYSLPDAAREQLLERITGHVE